MLAGFQDSQRTYVHEQAVMLLTMGRAIQGGLEAKKLPFMTKLSFRFYQNSIQNRHWGTPLPVSTTGALKDCSPEELL